MSQNWTPPSAGGGSAPIPNYLVPSIVAILCCWPLAIPAIIMLRGAIGTRPGPANAAARTVVGGALLPGSVGQGQEIYEAGFHHRQHLDCAGNYFLCVRVRHCAIEQRPLRRPNQV